MRTKPSPPPQIPSTPEADQAAIGFLFTTGFKLRSWTSDKTFERALLWAIENKRGDAVRLLLNKGASTDINDGSSEIFIHKAASNNDVKVIKVLLHQQFNLEAKRPDGCTALHIAAAKGHGPTVSLLLQAGADPHTMDSYGRNALQITIDNKTFFLIATLVKHGAEIDIPNRGGLTALHIAVMNKDSPLMRTLLYNGADLAKRTSQGKTACDFALGYQSEDAIAALLDSGAHFDLCIPGRGLLMSQMIDKHGIHTIVRPAMVQHVQAVTACSGTTALHIAAERGYNVLIELLLDSGSDINGADDLGYTALHFACCGVNVSTNVAKLLISRGADPLTKCKSGSTALHMVAEQGDLELTKMILAPLPSSPETGYNVMVEIQDLEGRTPMYLAIMNGHIDVVRLFIAMDANHMITDNYGRSAAWRAWDSNYWQVLEVLRPYEAKITSEERAPYRLRLWRSIWTQRQMQQEAVWDEMCRDRGAEDNHVFVSEPKTGVSVVYRILFARTTGFNRKYRKDDWLRITSAAQECDNLRRSAKKYRPDLVPVFDPISPERVASTPPDEEGNVFCAVGLRLGGSWAFGHCWFHPSTKEISRKKILAAHEKIPGVMQQTGFGFYGSEPTHPRDANGNKFLLMYNIARLGEKLLCFAKEGRDKVEPRFTDPERWELGIGQQEYRKYHGLTD